MFEKLSSQSAVAGQEYFIEWKWPVVLWDFINEILSCHNLPRTTRRVPERVVFNIGLFFEC
jgi:hypothetical protein